MPHETTVRLASFLSVFAVVALFEYLAPRRPLTTPKGQRWLVNGSIVVLDTLVVRYVSPLLPNGLAELAAVNGWGVLNLVALPFWSKVLIAFMVFDLIIYLQHRAFHRIPILWRLHRIHHTDLDLDVSSGIRFHPIEIIISICIKMAVVVLIGAPPLAVVLFEIILNATSLFNHGNMAIPLPVDRWLRLFLVTPDMHRVHHSVIPRETDSNFCFNFPWWDRLMGTYRAQPVAGHDAMQIGLKEFRSAGQLGLLHLLVLPFKGRRG
ncbi:MAG: sterol desaturase family protein [Geobacter sp.]|nr:sterol desaturase family protein [Geobacter sp.]